jgi:hypothetical protein
MRKKHGADWWKKVKKKAPAKGSFKITWPRTLTTKDGAILKHSKTGKAGALYYDHRHNEHDEYIIHPIGGGKYSLVWSEEDVTYYEDLLGEQEYHPEFPVGEIVDKTILKSATPAQIKKKIESTNRPRLVKYNPRRRR